MKTFSDEKIQEDDFIYGKIWKNLATLNVSVFRTSSGRVSY